MIDFTGRVDATYRPRELGIFHEFRLVKNVADFAVIPGVASSELKWHEDHVDSLSLGALTALTCEK